MTPFDVLAAFWLALAPTAHASAASLPSQAATEEVPRALALWYIPAQLLEVPDEELLGRVGLDPESLGSLAIGTAGGGRLMNAVQLMPSPRWEIAPAAISWGTAETMAAIDAAVALVHEVFPDTPPIFIGDISHREGGRLKRHETHQSGTDVDFGFYYRPGTGRWYAPGTAANLDLPRNWALVRSLLLCTDVERILLDTRIQRLLYRHALSIGEDKDWLDRLFGFVKGSSTALVRHVAGHRTHYHVRFYNPVAQELGRRAHPFLVELQVLPPPVYTVRHTVTRGQTLGHLARRYGTSVQAIMQANGLRSTQLRAGRAYRIPMRAAAPPSVPLVVPPRPVPPLTPPALAQVDWPSAPPAYQGTR
ncbi:MAG TPA: penicillin-insensitive murein endopeptidase [Vicinamibacterales bacterium]|nr:penicillin-insensitive murein endopeptidase [Vicinamibacterales bacterium]